MKTLKEISYISDKCIDCQLCLKQCSFLDAHGTPGEICDRFLHGQLVGKQTISFQCNLCGLCTVVCPLDLKIADAFLTMRRQLAKTLAKDLPQHRPLKGFEWLGTSPLFRYTFIPKNCDTVFFPGCGLVSTRPATVETAFSHLRSLIPDLGMVLNCCARISHDLGQQQTFEKRFGRLTQTLKKNGVRHIITACPSCHTTFKTHSKDISCRMIYETLAESPPQNGLQSYKEAVVHDACATRHDENIHNAVRKLLSNSGTRIVPMKHERTSTLCCSEGGGASHIAPQITDNWIAIRREETQGKHCITYCSGCSSVFDNKDIANTHILDLLFAQVHPDKNARDSRWQAAKYLQRFLLKIRLMLRYRS